MALSFLTQDEDGQLNGKDDVAFRREAEESKPRVWWANNTVRVFLTPAAITRAQKTIAATRTIPFELRRTAVAAGKVAVLRSPSIQWEETLYDPPVRIICTS